MKSLIFVIIPIILVSCSVKQESPNNTTEPRPAKPILASGEVDIKDQTIIDISGSLVVPVK